ncbi:MAG: NUDIX domain-containing protein [Acidobacteria bacterium]|nr:NUDIX domain-containing protein [Acidobacteriota bacterium]
MPKPSAGILLFRRTPQLEVFLIHPGGPYLARKDLGAWSIPKGEYDPPEQPLDAAIREFTEETGFPIQGPFIPLPEIRQAGGKFVKAWAVEGDCDPAQLHSNTFTLEWPPRSGRIREYPEVDRGGWFSLELAAAKINPAQAVWLTQLPALLI